MSRQVDFYILDQTKNLKGFMTLCHLIEKLYAQHPKIYIHTDNEQECDLIDKQLWTFKDISFIPHEVCINKTNAAIQIGHQQTFTGNNFAAMINTSNAIPQFYELFPTIIEIVFKDENLQQLARERYKKYRDVNCVLNTYKYN